ncbi:MAG: MBL fold metallo-hydrolase [Verrucomicrobiae bacterium]|nr:MBL fold metallo-hydrolase [Verrucomicrobiae bacterium]
MSEKFCITVLVENSVHRRGLKAEHGLSFLIESGGRRVLFDTGQTELVLENAGTLGCSLEDLDAIVLSHGHDDHTGGLAAVRHRSPNTRVFLHPAAMQPKFSGSTPGVARYIGMPEASRQAVAGIGKNLVVTQTHQEVIQGVFVTGEIPRRTDFEDVGGRFFLDEQCQQPDPLMDDQALYFPTAEGVVVVLGCAHAGVVNTLLHIEQLVEGAPLRAVLGGMHLLNASPERLADTVEALRRWNVPLLAPAHCTGLVALARLWESFPGRCAAADVGSRFVFER